MHYLQVNKNELLKILRVRRYEYVAYSFDERFSSYDEINEFLDYINAIDNEIKLIERCDRDEPICLSSYVYRDMGYMLGEDDDIFKNRNIDDENTVDIDRDIVDIIASEMFITVL